MKFALLFTPLALLVAQSANVPVDNEFVRVVLGMDRPVAAPGPEHEHKLNRVMIYLDSGDIQIKHSEGKVENQHWKAGDIAWSPAGGRHTSQNISPKPVRVVEIEIKSPGTKEAAAPDRTNAVLDNSQVRVYRANSAPRSRNYVAVDPSKPTVLWNKMPEGAGPFVITEIR